MGEEGELPPDSEKISRAAMLQAYTLNAAKVMGRDKETGSLSVGKSADMVLFDRNLEKVSIEKLRDAPVLWTMFAGREVYSGM
jgi:predicted amidohydrolase YtcJ